MSLFFLLKIEQNNLNQPKSTKNNLNQPKTTQGAQSVSVPVPERVAFRGLGVVCQRLAARFGVRVRWWTLR